MIEITDKENCCGCHACYNICPRKAISMIEDKKGFKYPVIDKEKCIECNLCKNVCPILTKKTEKRKNKVWIMYNKNKKERINSSSGGIFILLAKEILLKKGVVFGACFDEFYNVHHSYIDNINDINKLQGSKYVQSNIDDSYNLVKNFLEEGKLVLFTGTSCQIEGLYSFLRKKYNNLYTQDIICHGVPSPKVWQKYLEYQKEKYGEQIKDISFRNKDNGWSLFQTKISFQTKKYIKDFKNDLYMNAFLYDICLRDSCYNCKFKEKYRNSDITLADFWGIDKIDPNMNDDKGVSAVIVNTNKGEELFETIKKQCVYKKCEIDDIIKYNSAYVQSSKIHKNSMTFFEYLDNKKFDKLIKKYIKKPSIYRKRIKNVIKKILKK